MTVRGDLGTMDSFELVQELLEDRQETGESLTIIELQDLCKSVDARLEIVGPLVLGPHLIPPIRFEEDKEMARAVNILETLHGRSFDQKVSRAPEQKDEK